MAYYIKVGSVRTDVLGWDIPRGGRSCPPPTPKRVAITGIPYRNGDIELTDAMGTAAMGNRTLSYTLRQSGYANEAAADSSAASLAATFAKVANKELYDSKGGCTYTNVTCTDVSINDDMYGIREVTLTLTAAPYTKEGGL